MIAPVGEKRLVSVCLFESATGGVDSVPEDRDGGGKCYAQRSIGAKHPKKLSDQGRASSGAGPVRVAVLASVSLKRFVQSWMSSWLMGPDWGWDCAIATRD